MHKEAAMIDTGVSDPAWGRSIKVSYTTWSFYMEMLNLEDHAAAAKFRQSIQSYGDGVSLREIIARDFAKSAGRVAHYFKLGNKEDEEREWAEIRNVVMSGKGSSFYFISAVRPNSVDILCVQSTMYPVKYHRKTPTGI
jgi:hypothetical protein